MTNYYATLGISPGADSAEVKRAYRKLASQHHPDRGGDPERFKQIQEAYDALTGAQQQQNPFFSHHSGASDFDDILNSYFTKFDVREHMRNSRIVLHINLQDVAKGGPHLVTVNTKNGSMPVEIDIPQGINNGETVRYPKLLPRGIDLIVEFRTNAHPEWQRQGLDLWCTKQLNFWQLIVGAEVPVIDLLGRTYNLKVPPRTKPNSSLRIRGKGLERERAQGDILVKVEATMPDHVPEEIVQILSKININK